MTLIFFSLSVVMAYLSHYLGLLHLPHDEGPHVSPLKPATLKLLLMQHHWTATQSHCAEWWGRRSIYPPRESIATKTLLKSWLWQRGAIKWWSLSKRWLQCLHRCTVCFSQFKNVFHNHTSQGRLHCGSSIVASSFVLVFSSNSFHNPTYFVPCSHLFTYRKQWVFIMCRVFEGSNISLLPVKPRR